MKRGKVSNKERIFKSMVAQRSFLPHVRAQTHIQFFRSHSNQTHTLQNNPTNYKNLRLFPKKTYKTTFRILLDLTIPREHRTTRKQYQNRKLIKTRHFSTLCHHTFENAFLINFSIFLLNSSFTYK